MIEWFKLVQTVDVRVNKCKLDGIPVAVKEKLRIGGRGGYQSCMVVVDHIRFLV